MNNIAYIYSQNLVSSMASKTDDSKSGHKVTSLLLSSDNIELMNNITWLKQYVIDMKSVSRDDVIGEALRALADKMDYDSLCENYKDKMPKDTSPRRGPKKSL